MTLAAKSFKMMKEWNSNSWKVPLSVDTTPLRGKEEEGGGRRSVVTSQIWTDRLLIKLNWCLYINRSFSYRRWKELRSDQFWIAADRECALFDNNLRNKSLPRRQKRQAVHHRVSIANCVRLLLIISAYIRNLDYVIWSSKLISK